MIHDMTTSSTTSHHINIHVHPTIPTSPITHHTCAYLDSSIQKNQAIQIEYTYHTMYTYIYIYMQDITSSNIIKHHITETLIMTTDSMTSSMTSNSICMSIFIFIFISYSLHSIHIIYPLIDWCKSMGEDCVVLCGRRVMYMS